VAGASIWLSTKTSCWVYGPGPSSNVSASSRCWAPATWIAGVYASVRSIAAFSAAVSMPEKELGPVPDSVWIRPNRPARWIVAGCGVPPPPYPATISTITINTRTASPANVRRRRWCGSWLHFRPFDEGGREGGALERLRGGVAVSGIRWHP
jgi:hypothetical protein